MRKVFIQSLIAHQTGFGQVLSEEDVERLADYYELVQEHNPLLHLVAPCSAEEFAVRHILESLTLLEYLPKGAKFADVGTGAGLPSIPCLLVRRDLKAVLIESKEKKAAFLGTAAEVLGISDRTHIINKQFLEVGPPDCKFVTCRAIDKFSERLPRLMKWSGKREMLLFGGEALKKALLDQQPVFTQRLLPLSEQRFLFIV